MARLPRSRFGFDARSLIRLAAPVCILLAGCQTLGPQAIVAGRAAYNDVIARTTDEQTLGVIVRMRYGDPIGLLAVSNVTANLRFSARAASDVAFGNEANYKGNLVPFSAGVGYEDSPTISYLPVAGQAFLAEWLKPISLDTVLLSTQAAGRGEKVFKVTVDRLNGLRSGDDASPAQRAGFNSALELLDELQAAGIADWIAPFEAQGNWELVISGYAPTYTRQVEELLRLFGTPASTAGGAKVRLVVSIGSQAGNDGGLSVKTRSVGAILRGAAQRVEVPEEHLQAGVVAHSSEDGRGGGLRIRSSRDAPGNANLAVQHRGWWYYVDDTDLESKQVFRGIQELVLAAIVEGGGKQAAPMLTIPVR